MNVHIIGGATGPSFRSSRLLCLPAHTYLHHCLDPYSAYSKELLEKVLRAASYTETLNFFCFICEIPHKAPLHPFKSLHPHLHIAGGDPLPGLRVVRVSDAQAVDGMEHTSQCLITLLKAGLNSEGLIGGFFIKCLNHLNTTISNRGTQPDIISGANIAARSSSSLLLACEDALTSGEVSSGASLLHTAAALCEFLGQEVIAQSDRPSLLIACRRIVDCHAQVLERGGSGVRLTARREEPAYEEVVVGGALSLSIVLGLLSAVMAGAGTVSYAKGTVGGREGEEPAYEEVMVGGALSLSIVLGLLSCYVAHSSRVRIKGPLRHEKMPSYLCLTTL